MKIRIIHAEKEAIPEEETTAEKENERLAGDIVKYERNVEDRVGKIEKTIIKAERALDEIHGMSRLAFGFGYAFLIISIILFIVQVGASLLSIDWPENLQIGALGMGAIGIVDLVGLMLYKPMDRIQKATSDFSQLTLVSNNYVMAMKLIMLGTSFMKEDGKTYNHESIMKAVDSLTDLMTASVEAIQQYTE